MIDEGSASIEKRLATGCDGWWRSKLVCVERIFVNFFVAVALVVEGIAADGGSEAAVDERVGSWLGVDFSSGMINFGAVEEDDEAIESVFV